MRLPARLSVCAAPVLAFLLLAHAQEPTNSKADALKKPEVVHGQQVFTANCAACHGASATGGMGPNLLASSYVRHDQGGADIAKIIQEGRMDKGMPAFPQIPDADRHAIAAWLHARIDASARASALGVSAFSGNLNVGDATAGKTYFAAHCSNCHSSTGDLAGIATRHDPPSVEQSILMPKTEDTGSVIAAGRTYTGLFLHRDAFTITLRDSGGLTHTWNAEAVTVKRDDKARGHRDLLKTYTDKDIHDVFAYLETLR
jgi:cytochrome c oxidase cbb3-type subunit III